MAKSSFPLSPYFNGGLASRNRLMNPSFSSPRNGGARLDLSSPFAASSAMTSPWLVLSRQRETAFPEKLDACQRLAKEYQAMGSESGVYTKPPPLVSAVRSAMHRPLFRSLLDSPLALPAKEAKSA